jgi:hypothetical protein
MNAASSEDLSEEAAREVRETFHLKRRAEELVFRNAEPEVQATRNKRCIIHLESMLHNNDDNVADLFSVGEEVLVVVVSFLPAENITNLGRTGK